VRDEQSGGFVELEGCSSLWFYWTLQAVASSSPICGNLAHIVLCEGTW